MATQKTKSAIKVKGIALQVENANIKRNLLTSFRPNGTCRIYYQGKQYSPEQMDAMFPTVLHKTTKENPCKKHVS
jgi:hypothetical protein